MVYKILIAAVLVNTLFCCESRTPNVKKLDFEVFTLDTPKNWKKITIRGLDSYVGGLTNGTDTIIFDYGDYSPEIGEEDSTKHKFQIDTISGLRAKIVFPNIDGQGHIGLSISKFKDSQNTFYIGGKNINGTDTVLKILRSVKFRKE